MFCLIVFMLACCINFEGIKLPEINESYMIKTPKTPTNVVYLSLWIFLGIINGMNFVIYYSLFKLLPKMFSFSWNSEYSYTYFVANIYYFICYGVAHLLGVIIYLGCVFALCYMITDLSDNIIKLITNSYDRDFPKVKITTENGETKARIADLRDKELITLSEENVVIMIPWNKIEILEASKIEG